MIKAVWGLDYDYRTDKCYQCPVHEECDAPIALHEGRYYCVGCGEDVELDDDMKAWIDERSGEKTEAITCMGCGEKTLQMKYHKNKVTKKWEPGFGHCTNCGAKIII